MRQTYKEHRVLLIASVIFSILSSFAIPFIAFALKYDAKWAKTPISLLFWLGLIGEQVCFWHANSILKKLRPTIKTRFKPKIGLISPFGTSTGAIADIVFAVSFIAFIILCIFKIGENNFQYLFLFLLVLSFRLHCILNGKNFWYSNLLSRRDKRHG